MDVGWKPDDHVPCRRKIEQLSALVLSLAVYSGGFSIRVAKREVPEA